jgi:HSP20 family protein
MSEHADLHHQANRMQADMDRMYEDSMPTRWVVMRHTHTWRPPTDVYETDDAIIVRVEVAGMTEADFSLELQGRLLIIGGVRQDPSPKVAFHQMEIRYGEFRVEVYLHWAVDMESIKATYSEGFLQIALPKTQARKVHIVEMR